MPQQEPIFLNVRIDLDCFIFSSSKKTLQKFHRNRSQDHSIEKAYFSLTFSDFPPDHTQWTQNSAKS